VVSIQCKIALLSLSLTCLQFETLRQNTRKRSNEKMENMAKLHEEKHEAKQRAERRKNGTMSEEELQYEMAIDQAVFDALAAEGERICERERREREEMMAARP